MTNLTPEQIVQALRAECDDCSGCNPMYYCPSPDAADTIERLLSEISALKEANRWVPVSEIQPSESGRYLAYIHREATEALGGNSDFLRIKMFMNGEWAMGTHSPAWINDELRDTVTHWRPLPQPPEIEKGCASDGNISTNA